MRNRSLEPIFLYWAWILPTEIRRFADAMYRIAARDDIAPSRAMEVEQVGG
jgi:hypothetical protein